MTRRQEKEAGKIFGKYVTKEKALTLAIATTLTCLMPALVGVRLWDSIPEIVETGLIGASGSDDSMPRAVLVFGIPGLMAVLNIICHGQLWLNQKAEKLAPQASRIVGRWGFPVLSSLFASGCTLSAAGVGLKVDFVAPCVLSLIFLLLGSHFFDCPKESKISFRLRVIERNPAVWSFTHRLAGICWMLAGLIILLFITLYGTLPAYSAVITVVLLALALPVGAYKAKSGTHL